MLKPKDLPAASGAEHLAVMMADYTQGMNVHEIALQELVNAPAEWNFFKPLPEGKFFELVDSIEENGLLVPLIVWEQPGMRYMLLSGHNRRNALQLLFGRSGDEKYSRATCVVYRADELDDDTARAILVDCNWVQRSLTTSEKARAIYTKYVELGRLKKGAGHRRYEDVAEHFGLKATQVYQYYKLAQLDSHWLDQVDEGKLPIRAAAHLCTLTDEQRELLRMEPRLDSKQILAIDNCLTLDETKRALARKEAEMRELRVMVPADKYKALLRMVNEWLGEEEERL